MNPEYPIESVFFSATVQYFVVYKKGLMPKGSISAASFWFFKSLVSTCEIPYPTSKSQTAQKRNDGAPSQYRDGKDDRRNEQRVGNGKNQNRLPVRRPHHGPKAFRIYPGHVFCGQNSCGNAEQRNHRNQRRAQKSSRQIINLADGRAEQDLMSVVSEIA